MYVIVEIDTAAAEKLKRKLDELEPGNWLVKGRDTLYGKRVNAEMLPGLADMVFEADPRAMARVIRW